MSYEPRDMNDPDLLPVPERDFLTPEQADMDDTVDNHERLDQPRPKEERE